MTVEKRHFDVAVIGGGHAGCEAALAAARLGAETCLITVNIDHIAQMSCNPAVGGIAKGQITREIDALGGEMGRNADASGIQFRMLNRSKGPAVWSPRAQCDKMVYQYRYKWVIESQSHLSVLQDHAIHFTFSNGDVTGLATALGLEIRAQTIVIATGTFLNGTLHYGDVKQGGGRAGDPASCHLASELKNNLGLHMERLKTGTPPRLLGPSIDFTALYAQAPDVDADSLFSFQDKDDAFRNLRPAEPQKAFCYLSQTTAETAEIVRTNIDKSPMYSGDIAAQPTRYCPSFEDKIVRFPQRGTHHIYLEPEGTSTAEYYLNGISTSLPPPIQTAMVRSIPGLENARISRFGYAIEYDIVLPWQLTHGLNLRKYPNIFLAGQINGTSGYEEAAAQGLLAGINATRKAAGKDSPEILGRQEAYIGVLVDDLVTKDITEPYRMFTSRAEYRLLLRQDNAHRRLTPIGYRIGLLSERQYHYVSRLEEHIQQVKNALQQGTNTSTTWEMLQKRSTEIDLRRDFPHQAEEVLRQVEIEAKYAPYIQRENRRAAEMANLEKWHIPASFDFSAITGLRKEARDKLEQVRPANLSQASRIDGVTPAELALLQVHLKRH